MIKICSYLPRKSIKAFQLKYGGSSTLHAALSSTTQYVRTVLGKNPHLELKGELHPKPRACFVRCLTSINTFWISNVNSLKQIVGKLKDTVRILVGKAVLELMIKTIFCTF